MLNYIWLALITMAVVIGAATGRLTEVTTGAFSMAETAVMRIALPLVGVMALWLGLMRIAERAGLVQALARALRPVMRRLFPEVPVDHPAMGSMVMNMAANMLGLANAATPLGLRAMRDLETLNPNPGTATNAMCTFLAINTSSIQLIPTTAIAILASQGSKDPTAIVGTALIATTCSTVAGVGAVKWMQGWRIFRAEPAVETPGAPAAPPPPPPEPLPEPGPLPAWGRAVLWLFAAAVLGLFLWVVAAPDSYRATATALHGAIFPANVPPPKWEDTGDQAVALRAIGTLSLLAVPLMILFFPFYASLRGVKVYEEFVEGAKEGFGVAVRIVPFLVAILVAIGMFRGAGGIDALKALLSPVLVPLGFPPELLPMTLMRPLSGSATTALFAEVVQTAGPDSLVALMGGTIFGSTETTFYVIAVYFGSVAIRRTRHALAAGLTADFFGVVASVIVCRLMFG
jgi:spore maturation protein SpmA